MVQKLDNMGLKYFRANPDVWIRHEIKYYGMEYYEYILVYIDDLLSIYMHVIEVLQEIQCTLNLCNNKVENNSNSIGASLKQK